MTLAHIRWQNNKLVTHSFDIYLLTFNVGNSLFSPSLSICLFVSVHTYGFLFDSVVYNVPHVVFYLGAQSAPDLPSGTPFRVTLRLLLTDHTTFLELFFFWHIKNQLLFKNMFSYFMFLPLPGSCSFSMSSVALPFVLPSLISGKKYLVWKGLYYYLQLKCDE